MKTSIVTALLFLSSAALADTYNVDSEASHVQWKAGKKIGTFHHGDIKIKSGTIETDAKGKIKSAVVVVDMKTIADEDLKGSPDFQKKLVGHLSSEDFFNVEKFPEARFEFTSATLKPGSKNEYVVKGQLTMIGNTQAIEFPAQIDSASGKITGHALVRIERLKWGLKYGSGSLFKSLTADKIINDYFEMTLDISASK